MKEYMIQSADNEGDLEDRVSHGLREGWVCAGGIAIGVVDNEPFYYQAMTRDLPVEAKSIARSATKQPTLRAVS